MIFFTTGIQSHLSFHSIHALFHLNLANYFLLFFAFSLNTCISFWAFHLYIPAQVCDAFFQLLSWTLSPSILPKRIFALPLSSFFL